ncbi:MAG: methyltransferase domain-containing protein [Candidatus Zapsychrus exili]|nr:methyltransferase domain-containing protein [Candidatus Zapsychrus exili]
MDFARYHIKNRYFIKKISLFVLFFFCFGLIVPPRPSAQPIQAQIIATNSGVNPTLIKGLNVFPDNPFRFDFIIDRGLGSMAEGLEFKVESEKLIKYFLAALTVPEDDLWVNLSPIEEDRVISEDFGKTEMGRQLLIQDYLLKQVTSSLMHPEGELGKKFWNEIYGQAQNRYDLSDIETDVLSKVWIMPSEAEVYEHDNTVFIISAKLKVFLKEGYEESNIIKEIIIPELERQVNEDETFAPLRQVYHSLILAAWYKQVFKTSIINKIYSDKNKIAGVNPNDPEFKEKIYQDYMKTFKEGVYNHIKEEYDPKAKSIVPRKYFSGGVFGKVTPVLSINKNSPDSAMISDAIKHSKIVQTVINPFKRKRKVVEDPYPLKQDEHIFISIGDVQVAIKKYDKKDSNSHFRDNKKDIILSESDIKAFEDRGFKRHRIKSALRFLPKTQKLYHKINSKKEGRLNAFLMIKKDIEQVIEAKQKQGLNEIVVYEIGPGEDSKEFFEIVKMFNDVIKQKAGFGWMLKMVVLDYDRSILDSLFDSITSKENNILSNFLDINLEVELHAVDVSDVNDVRALAKKLKKMKEPKEYVDYMFARNVLLAQDMVQDGLFDFLQDTSKKDIQSYIYYTGLFKNYGLKNIFNSYLSLKNIVGYFSNVGTKLIVEPASFSRGKIEKVLRIPGAEILTANHYAIDNKSLKHGLRDIGTGIHEIKNTKIIGRKGIDYFIEQPQDNAMTADVNSFIFSENKIEEIKNLLDSKNQYSSHQKEEYFKHFLLSDLEEIFSKNSIFTSLTGSLFKELLVTVKDISYDQFDWIVYRLFEIQRHEKQIKFSSVKELIETILSETPPFSFEHDSYGPKYYGVDRLDDFFAWSSGTSSMIIDQFKSMKNIDWPKKEILEISPGQDGKIIEFLKNKGAKVSAVDRSFRGARLARQKYGVEAKVTDILELLDNLKNKKYDVIVAASVLSYVIEDNAYRLIEENVDKVIKSIKGSLKEGGLFFCTFHFDESENDGKVYDHRPSMKVLDKFRAAGFEVVRNINNRELLMFRNTPEDSVMITDVNSFVFSENKIEEIKNLLDSKNQYSLHQKEEYFKHFLLSDLEEIFSKNSVFASLAGSLFKELLVTAKDISYNQFDWVIYRLFEIQRHEKQIKFSSVKELIETILSETPPFSFEHDSYGPKYYGADRLDDFFVWSSGTSSMIIDQFKGMKNIDWPKKEILEISPGQDGKIIEFLKNKGAKVSAVDRSFRGARLARQEHDIESKVADILELSKTLGGKKYDVIMAASVLKYVIEDNTGKWVEENVDKVIKSSKGSLKEGGLFFCTFHFDESENDGKTYDHRLPMKVLDKFKAAGFEVVRNINNGELLMFRNITEDKAMMADKKKDDLLAFFKKYNGPIYYPAGGVDLRSVKLLAHRFPKVNEFIIADPFYKEQAEPIFYLNNMKYTKDNMSEILENILSNFAMSVALGRTEIMGEIISEENKELKITILFNDHKKEYLSDRKITIRYLVKKFEKLEDKFDVVYVRMPGAGGDLSWESKFWENIKEQVSSGGKLLVSSKHTTRPFEDLFTYQAEFKNPTSTSGSFFVYDNAMVAEKQGINFKDEGLRDKEVSDNAMVIGPETKLLEEIGLKLEDVLIEFVEAEKGTEFWGSEGFVVFLKGKIEDKSNKEIIMRKLGRMLGFSHSAVVQGLNNILKTNGIQINKENAIAEAYELLEKEKAREYLHNITRQVYGKRSFNEIAVSQNLREKAEILESISLKLEDVLIEFVEVEKGTKFWGPDGFVAFVQRKAKDNLTIQQLAKIFNLNEEEISQGLKEDSVMKDLKPKSIVFISERNNFGLKTEGYLSRISTTNHKGKINKNDNAMVADRKAEYSKIMKEVLQEENMLNEYGQIKDIEQAAKLNNQFYKKRKGENGTNKILVAYNAGSLNMDKARPRGTILAQGIARDLGFISDDLWKKLSDKKEIVKEAHRKLLQEVLKKEKMLDEKGKIKDIENANKLINQFYIDRNGEKGINKVLATYTSGRIDIKKNYVEDVSMAKIVARYLGFISDDLWKKISNREEILKTRYRELLKEAFEKEGMLDEKGLIKDILQLRKITWSFFVDKGAKGGIAKIYKSYQSGAVDIKGIESIHVSFPLLIASDLGFISDDLWNNVVLSKRRAYFLQRVNNIGGHKNGAVRTLNPITNYPWRPRAAVVNSDISDKAMVTEKQGISIKHEGLRDEEVLDNAMVGDVAKDKKSKEYPMTVKNPVKRLTELEARTRVLNGVLDLNKQYENVIDLLKKLQIAFKKNNFNASRDQWISKINEQIDFIKNSMLDILSSPSRIGFTDNDTKNKFDDFIDKIAKEFNSDKIIMWFDSGVTYSKGYSDKELSIFSHNASSIVELFDDSSLNRINGVIQESQDYREALSLIGGADSITVDVGKDSIGDLQDAYIIFCFVRSQDTVDRAGKFSKEELLNIYSRLNEMILNGEAVWTNKYKEFLQEYSGFLNFMSVLRHHSSINSILSPYLYLNDFTKDISGLVDDNEKVYDFYKELAKLEKVFGEFIIKNNIFIDAAKEDTSFYSVDIVQEIREIVSLYEDKIEEKGLKLDLNIDFDKKEIRTIPGYLKAIVDALLQNAVKYTEKGKINVRLYEGRNIDTRYNKNVGGLFLEIKDTGIGMSEEFKKNIFLPGTRGVNTKSYPGEGMDLSIIEAFAKIMFYSIEVSSEIDKGSTFTVFIPLKDQAMVADDQVGGIDMTLDDLNLKIRNSGEKIEFDATVLENMDFDGFVPVIINIMPATNLPMLLGITDQEPEEDSTAMELTPELIADTEKIYSQRKHYNS